MILEKKREVLKMRKLVYRFYNTKRGEILEVPTLDFAREVQTSEEYEAWQGPDTVMRTELVECSDHLVNESKTKWHLPTLMELANA